MPPTRAERCDRIARKAVKTKPATDVRLRALFCSDADRMHLICPTCQMIRAEQ